MRRQQGQQRRDGGFTLSELMIVIPISAIVMGTLYMFMVTLYMNNLKHIGRLDVVSQVNASLNIMREDIALSMGPSANLGGDVTDSYGPPGGGSWAGSSSTPFSTLIVKMPTTTAPTVNPNRELVRINQNGCTAAAMASNPVYSYRAVYYVHENNLYRRNVMDSTPPSLCQTPIQTMTCPTYVTAPANCVKDTLLATHVTKFEARYQVGTVGNAPSESCPAGSTFNQNTAEDVLYLCDSDTIAGASVVTVVLEQARRIDGKDFAYAHRFTVGNFTGDEDE
ncbi:prepilin-type N-terminal cleavage/methylation domain-containing protein [Candidatus Saccharibacteria bacterium]|nr:prepilin-type N-terminal cleavage/methylation domain-containing protein [Candidatus Saccharibacteria bacterium]